MARGNVLIVCTGNVCRSPYIEYRLRDLLGERGPQIASAGTMALAGAPIDPSSGELLAGHGIDASGFVARQLTADMVREADLILTAAREHRADVARNRASGSTGLGLSIVAAIVAAHDGEVSVRETPGGGATFVVSLPLAAPDSQAQHSSHHVADETDDVE